MVWILGNKRLIGLSRIDETFFVQIEIAEIHVHDVAVFGMTALVKEFSDALGAIHVREADTQDTKCVFNKFLVGAAQLFEAMIAFLQLDIADLAVN